MAAFLKRLNKKVTSRREEDDRREEIDRKRSSTAAASTPPRSSRNSDVPKGNSNRRSEGAKAFRQQYSKSSRDKRSAEGSRSSSASAMSAGERNNRSSTGSRQGKRGNAGQDSSSDEGGCCSCLSIFKSERVSILPRRDRRRTMLETATAMATLAEDNWLVGQPPNFLPKANDAVKKSLKWLDKKHELRGSEKWESMFIDSSAIAYSDDPDLEIGIGRHGVKSCLFRCDMPLGPVVVELFKQAHFTPDQAIETEIRNPNLVGIVVLAESKTFLRFGFVTHQIHF